MSCWTDVFVPKEASHLGCIYGCFLDLVHCKGHTYKTSWLILCSLCGQERRQSLTSIWRNWQVCFWPAWVLLYARRFFSIYVFRKRFYRISISSFRSLMLLDVLIKRLFHMEHLRYIVAPEFWKRKARVYVVLLAVLQSACTVPSSLSIPPVCDSLGPALTLPAGSNQLCYPSDAQVCHHVCPA